MQFEIIARDKKTKARIFKFKTKSGTIKTPFFMPVATKATGKFYDSNDMKKIKVKAIIANALLLSLEPSAAVIKSLGGIHRFMNFKGIIFTDSGGFQMYSEHLFLGINENGIRFRNPFTGQRILCTPEKDMQIQLDIASDVAMCLDDMPLYPAKKERLIQSVKRTIAWAIRCKRYHDKHNNINQLLFGIVQGGTDNSLRKICAKKLSTLKFPGYAIGGLAIGEPENLMWQATKVTLKHIPEKTPKYLMGLGKLYQLLKAISLGIDIFDSRYPTKTARHNQVFTFSDGTLKLQRKIYKDDKNPIDKTCNCPVCQNYSRAYLHHLIKIKEPNVKRLLSLHNLYFYQRLMEKAQESIEENKFHKLLEESKQWN